MLPRDHLLSCSVLGRASLRFLYHRSAARDPCKLQETISTRPLSPLLVHAALIKEKFGDPSPRLAFQTDFSPGEHCLRTTLVPISRGEANEDARLRQHRGDTCTRESRGVNGQTPPPSPCRTFILFIQCRY